MKIFLATCDSSSFRVDGTSARRFFLGCIQDSSTRFYTIAQPSPSSSSSHATIMAGTWAAHWRKNPMGVGHNGSMIYEQTQCMGVGTPMDHESLNRDHEQISESLHSYLVSPPQPIICKRLKWARCPQVTTAGKELRLRMAREWPK